ncbi:hypothetical protein NM208_g8134 [Fusarium decemcellulare]|uniref:Uncharacterized protein n=1 Tax=Fusarium decemcellulare TaxID=57161 RepID=A0ACC1S6J2_9HYPO|nr:hypothetical protein NM208_g8134 [Fusarium decemcellulare]
MVSLKLLTGALVAAAIVIAGPCRPSSRTDTSDLSQLSTSTASESVSSAQQTSTASTTENSSTETAVDTSTASSFTSTTFATESAATTSSASSDSYTTETTATETATTETTTGTTATETTAETSTTAITTTETTTTEATTSTETTSTEAIMDTTTTSVLPTPTAFKMVVQGGSLNGLVPRTNGASFVLYDGQLPATFVEASLTYSEDTQHLQLGDKTLCVMYDTSGRHSAVSICPSIVGVTGSQYYYLTCDKPSDTGLTCHVPGMVCGGERVCVGTNTAQTWSSFYLLSNPGGAWALLLGAGDLKQAEYKYQTLEAISIGVSFVY